MVMLVLQSINSHNLSGRGGRGRARGDPRSKGRSRPGAPATFAPAPAEQPAVSVHPSLSGCSIECVPNLSKGAECPLRADLRNPGEQCGLKRNAPHHQPSCSAPAHEKPGRPWNLESIVGKEWWASQPLLLAQLVKYHQAAIKRVKCYGTRTCSRFRRFFAAFSEHAPSTPAVPAGGK